MPDVPKAVLYSWPSSVWATVPRLCLHEKGYGDDEYVVRQVDLTKGENFSPAYLKINLNGTVPTLVIPTIETTGTDVDTKFRSLRDTMSICDFLDHARSAHRSNTSSARPAPSLSPATMEGKALSDTLIALVHLPTVDPNFLLLSARDSAELAKKSESEQGKMIRKRHEAIGGYILEAKALAQEARKTTNTHMQTYEDKMVGFLEDKLAANSLLCDLYDGKAGRVQEESFFEASRKAWLQGCPEAFAELDKTIRGPYALGDQVSLADLHVIPWLARLVDIAGGSPSISGIEALEKRMGLQVGQKTRAFWAAWVERESFKKEYVQGLH